MERERAKLEKERQHYANALERLVLKGDEEGADRIRHRLADVAKAIEDVDYRAANIRAGYVYVISNIGTIVAINGVVVNRSRVIGPARAEAPSIPPGTARISPTAQHGFPGEPRRRTMKEGGVPEACPP
jgi:hypothetical protein